MGERAKRRTGDALTVSGPAAAGTATGPVGDTLGTANRYLALARDAMPRLQKAPARQAAAVAKADSPKRHCQPIPHCRRRAMVATQYLAPGTDARPLH